MAAVDVLIPAYNAEATLRETLDSVLAQTFTYFRIVLVDDGSSDATPAIAAEYAQRDPRIHVISQANGGVVDALNAGLKYCNAEFLARLDSDDVARPGRLAAQLAYLESHPDCVAVGSGVIHIDERNALLTGVPHPAPVDAADPTRAPGQEPYIVHSTMFARRAVVEAVGGYRHSPNSEDSDLFWRLAEHGELFSLPEALVKYRVHAASISSSLLNGRIMAVGSQLAALSALRRRRNRADLVFASTLPCLLRDAASLEAMWEIVAPIAEADEREHLRICIATKLMELARYRPYELAKSDCAFIRASLGMAGHLTKQNQREIDWYVTMTAARLVRKGLLAEALALTPPQSYPVAAARVLLKR